MLQIWRTLRVLNERRKFFSTIFEKLTRLDNFYCQKEFLLSFKTRNMRQICNICIFKMLDRVQRFVLGSHRTHNMHSEKIGGPYWKFRPNFAWKLRFWGFPANISGREWPETATDPQYSVQASRGVSTSPPIIFRPFGLDPVNLRSKTPKFKILQKCDFLHFFTFRFSGDFGPLGHFGGPHSWI